MTLRLPASFSPAVLREEWFGNVRADLLAGVVVALALIPEAIAFSIIAGVDPKVGLYASFTIAVTTAFVGGRPGMISAATGAMALLMITLVRDYGLEYLFAATILTGVIQFAFGAFRLGRVMKFVPKAVMVGFVNALAILIFMAQLPQFAGAGWPMYAFVAAGLAIIYGVPRLTTAIPSPLIAIVVLTLVSLMTGFGLKTVGDMGELPTELPFFSLPAVPFALETLEIIFPISFALALVGLIESLLTAQIVDERTDTGSDKNREARGQGIANVITGFFGGMAGCAMIGQSVINVSSGGRGRLSTFSAGAFLLVFILVLGDWLVMIPMGALVAVMIMVSIGTFDWGSILAIRRAPKGETAVMLVTVATVVYTHDLSIGVLVGVVLSALLFARAVADHAFMEVRESSGGREHTYVVTGQLFFVTVNGFLEFFDYDEDVDRVVLDLSQSHVWDGSAVAAIDKAVLRYRKRGVEVEVVGLNERSASLLERLGTHDKPGAELALH
ncbi:SulP family inorganic anion transporter [Rubrivirga litoralis]|uniref:SulP family inorganic anion transporter n=1 Tax=Rubrivirga litoralis TaxID=3075598 RepID=A0ABU3BTH6_9BACT|nr:SulP family inorganic anion transporter [Rubrivirga sp. F394]MDT0632598.1 SulP family inorganic anion transporter [Rubrivirga sp. F394]